MNPVCGVILSAVLLGETDSLSVMPVAALVLVCMGIYIVNRPKTGGIEKGGTYERDCYIKKR